MLSNFVALYTHIYILVKCFFSLTALQSSDIVVRQNRDISVRRSEELSNEADAFTIRVK